MKFVNVSRHSLPRLRSDYRAIYLPVRYQTNANAGPSSGTVLANGVTATLNNQFTKSSDENFFISGTVRHTYDLQLQAGEVWETNATLYASEQEQQNQLDLIFLNFDSGPRGPFATGWLEAASWRPYVSGSYIRLDDVPYLEQLGLGVNFMDQLSPRVLLDTNIEHSQRQFHDGAGGSRTITELDGSTTDARVAFRFALSDDAQLTLALDHTDQSVSGSRNSFRENHEWTGSVGVTKVYPGPRKLREWAWAPATILGQRH